MLINWPLSKTHRHRCPDGTIKTVYKNLDDAFPLFIPGWKSNLAADVKAQELGNAHLTAEHESKIQGLLFSLDELNQSHMMNFRGAYVAYTADPCGNADLFVNHVGTILKEQTRLLTIRTLIRALIDLAESQPHNHDRIMDTFQRIVDRLGGSAVSLAAKAEIASTRDPVQEWIGGRDER